MWLLRRRIDLARRGAWSAIIRHAPRALGGAVVTKGRAQLIKGTFCMGVILALAGWKWVHSKNENKPATDAPNGAYIAQPAQERQKGACQVERYRRGHPWRREKPRASWTPFGYGSGNPRLYRNPHPHAFENSSISGNCLRYSFFMRIFLVFDRTQL